MTLEVQISTYGPQGLERVGRMTLPRVDGVTYFVSFQNPSKQPWTMPEALSGRPDITVSEHGSRGLSANRNHALGRGDSDIILIADDDLSYTAQQLQAVMKTFADRPDLDYATFMYEGSDARVYPDRPFRHMLPEPRGYSAASIELALRRSSLPSAQRYDERFGVGTDTFGAAEDSLFMLALQRNPSLCGMFFPIVITRHDGLSTGHRRPSASVLRAQGAWLRIRYGAIWGLLRLLRDVPRRHTSWPRALIHMIHGYMLSLTLNSANNSPQVL